MFGRGLQTSGDRLHSMKLPEAMVAFAQAAAKATDLHGWPLMSNKVQLQKCDKCSLEFYSPLNQRRHMRATHRRPLNVDKEDLKTKREQVAAYWDKLTHEEASEIVSLKNISLEDLSAASIVQALSTHLQQPGLLLPQRYINVGTALLDIVQNKPSIFPLQSEELFNLLQDASEKNLLCGVTSTSMQRCIFDSEPGRVGLEMKNLVAALGFLIELRLVKAWMDDKDVEALRCQRALVEEEEAAQKKRAKLQERKRQRKMRQKELKEKEQKGSESLSGFHQLDFDPFSRGGSVVLVEGDDSSTATQSSPSSSGHSGQDANQQEMSPLDNEYEDCDDVKDANRNGIVAEVEQGLHVDFDDEQDGCWPDTATFLEEKTALEKSGDSTNFGAEGASDGFFDHRVDNGRSFMQVRTLNGNFFPERKIGGWGWRERRQNDVSDFSSYQKPPHNYDRSDYDYSYGRQNMVRNPYNVAGSSAPEPLGISTVSKANATPRYGQYREKYPGLRRPSPNAAGRHAVWARKTQLSPSSELDRADENKLDDVAVGNGFSETAVDRQEECLSHEDYCIHDSNCAASAMVTGDISPDTCPVSIAKFEGGLSRDSSLSLDSITSDSSVSVSDRVGAEEQANHDDLRGFLPTKSLFDPVSDVDVLNGTAGEKLDTAIGALVIGSLRIPFGSVMSNSHEHAGHVADSCEAAEHLLGDYKNISVKSQQITVQESIEPLLGTEKFMSDIGSSVITDAALNASSHCLQEVGTSPLHTCTEASFNVRDATARKMVAGEESPHAFGEKLSKRCQWPNGVNKAGMIKMWRPVAVGERIDTLTASSFSGAETVVEEGPDVTNNTNILHRGASVTSSQAGITSSTESNRVNQSHANRLSSDEDAGNPLHMENTEQGYHQSSPGHVSFVGTCNGPSESDAFETNVCSEEFSSTCHYKVADGAEAALSSRSQLFLDIANFLSQRNKSCIIILLES